MGNNIYFGENCTMVTFSEISQFHNVDIIYDSQDKPRFLKILAVKKMKPSVGGDDR